MPMASRTYRVMESLARPLPCPVGDFHDKRPGPIELQIVHKVAAHLHEMLGHQDDRYIVHVHGGGQGLVHLVGSCTTVPSMPARRMPTQVSLLSLMT